MAGRSFAANSVTVRGAEIELVMGYAESRLVTRRDAEDAAASATTLKRR
jgi:hypothetical protein